MPMSVQPLLMNSMAGPPRITSAVQYSTTYIADEIVNTTETVITDYKKNTTMLHDVNELTWLNVSNSTQPSITLNATNTTYQILMNTVSKISNNNQ